MGKREGLETGAGQSRPVWQLHSCSARRVQAVASSRTLVLAVPSLPSGRWQPQAVLSPRSGQCGCIGGLCPASFEQVSLL